MVSRITDIVSLIPNWHFFCCSVKLLQSIRKQNKY